jgi:hypothetical protein
MKYNAICNVRFFIQTAIHLRFTVIVNRPFFHSVTQYSIYTHIYLYIILVYLYFKYVSSLKELGPLQKIGTISFKFVLSPLISYSQALTYRGMGVKLYYSGYIVCYTTWRQLTATPPRLATVGIVYRCSACNLHGKVEIGVFMEVKIKCWSCL